MRPADPDGFRRAFGGAPEFAVRAPGRVNLIGEHIDYLDLPVLPMTLDRGITLTCAARNEAIVRLRNLSATHEPVELRFDRLPGVRAGGHWGNYVATALNAAHELGAGVGFDAVVDSDLPPAAGLSSSSALVVAVALAALAAAGVAPPAPHDLADLLARAERGTGTQGGQMDQTVILAGRASGPLLVTRRPPAARPLPLPSDWSFVVAHSLETAEKSGGARDAYNARRGDADRAIGRVARRLGAPEAGLPELIDQFGTPRLREEAEHVPPREKRRFRHAVTENDRVARAVEALRAEDRTRFGHLMLESHASLRDDCEVSTPSLDRLVELMMEAGADGARLTGAGFGGCVLALSRSDAAPDLIAALDRRLYSRARTEVARLDADTGFPSVRFVANPGPPAGVSDV